MKINAQDTIYSTAAGGLKFLKVKHSNESNVFNLISLPLVTDTFTLNVALLTLHSISEHCVENCKPVSAAVAPKHGAAYFLYVSDSDLNVMSLQKKAQGFLRLTDDLCINLFYGNEEDLALVLSTLDSGHVSRDSLVFHCHLLGPRSTDKHRCQMKNWPRQNCCYVKA